MDKCGFSLIDLMVTVSIISILAAIAVPNYQLYQDKAKNAEAFSAMSSIVTMEKTYFHETNGYTNNLIAIGFFPEGGIRFNCGFDQLSPDIYGPNDPALGTYNFSFHSTAPNLCGNPMYAPRCWMINEAPWPGISLGKDVNNAVPSFIFTCHRHGTTQSPWFDINEKGIIVNSGDCC